MEITKLLLPGMLTRGSGIIINITSLAGQLPVPYMGYYSACKAALSSLTWNLEIELARQPVKVVELRPADIHTSFHHNLERSPALTDSSGDDDLARASRVHDRNMASAPPPSLVAAAVLKSIQSEGAGPACVSVGSFFQATLAPLLARLGPTRWVRHFLKKYYDLT